MSGGFLDWAAEHAPVHGKLTAGNAIKFMMGYGLWDEYGSNAFHDDGIDIYYVILRGLGKLSRYCEWPAGCLVRLSRMSLNEADPT